MSGKKFLKEMVQQIVTLFRWLVYSLVIGSVVGVVGTIFGYAMQIATKFRGDHNWVLYFLPLIGLLIVAIYQKSGMGHNKGTNLILEAVSSNETIPARVAPVISVSTVLTHLGGGSAGREGAALQLGGSLGEYLGRFFKVDDKDRKISVLCGMSAAFAALFGTPVTAAIFPMEVVSVGIMHYSALVPCVICAMTASGIAKVLGVSAEAFPVTMMPQMGISFAVRVLILAVLCGVLSTVFCNVLHIGEHLFSSKIANPYIRVMIGGVLIILLTLLVGNQDYNGAGMHVIETCVMEGNVFWAAFLLKMLFTSITLGSGFKGGEIVPTFFVGATFGCLLGSILGLPPTLASACGLVGVFCGVTNCPIASLFMGIELFGAAGLPCYLLMIAVSYCMSGYSGLYKSQKIIYSKNKVEYINRVLGE